MDIATLGVKVTSDGIDRATSELNNLTEAALRAEQAAAKAT